MTDKPCLKELDALIQRGNATRETRMTEPMLTVDGASKPQAYEDVNAQVFSSWKTQCQNFIRRYLSRNVSLLAQFNDATKYPMETSLQDGLGILEGLREDIRAGNIECESVQSPVAAREPLDVVLKTCDRFHRVALSLRKRRASREPLRIADEYDVQYLLSALLALEFDDIRREEPTPSFAGKGSRADFLVKSEKLFVECKMTREGMSERELGTQLNDDIPRYRSHQDCKRLVFFVYDPEHHITNPTSLIDDFTRDHDGLPVVVKVSPSP